MIKKRKTEQRKYENKGREEIERIGRCGIGREGRRDEKWDRREKVMRRKKNENKRRKTGRKIYRKQETGK